MLCSEIYQSQAKQGEIKMKAGNTILRGACVAFVVVGLMFMAKSEARIDPKSLIGMWLLDENRGDVVYDSSGNGHDGKFVNDVKWTDGKFDKAVVLTGESYLDHGALPTLDVGLGNFSLVAWVKTSGNPP